MRKEKTYWIGDNGDNKSVGIARKIYGRGAEIPAHEVSPELLEDWLKRGLISVGKKNAPIVIEDTEAVKNFEAEIRSLKARLDGMTALENENKKLRKALEKAKDGKKAERLKELEEYVKTKDAENADLKIDIEEKAALIEKQGKEIEILTSPPDGGNQ